VRRPITDWGGVWDRFFFQVPLGNMGMWPEGACRSWIGKMQPKQNTWNLVLFVVLSALVLVAWGRLQHWIAPPPRPSRPVVMRLPEPRLWADLPARALGGTVTPAVPTVGNLAQLTADMALVYWAAERPKAELARKPEREVQPPRELPKPPLPAGKHEIVSMGGEGFNLQATLTSRGAGVQSLVLTRFKAADEMGRPVDAPMGLIPEDNLNPSFTLDQANDDQHRLRDLEWTIVRRQTDPDKETQEVVLSADIADQGLRVTKTYTLARGDYHLRLTVEVERKNASAKLEPFSYVMTGAHGLPIEGVWYTNTYRNALIGTVDTTNHLWRDFQDARSIGASPHKEEKTDNSGYIQYAGVAIQYFASMIVVDDQQPKKDFLKEAQPFVAKPDPNPKRPYLDDISVRISTVPVELKSGDKFVHRYLLYNGPVKVQLLGDPINGGKPLSPELLTRYLDTLHLNTLTDYHSPGGMGWFASRIYWTNVLIFFTNLMHRVLQVLHTYIPFANYGICIILLTLLVRGMMHPISRKQARTSIKMQALVPELKKLQEKYKNDRQAQAMAQMELYRKHGVHPMGSCWVVFLQMPIFMGLYYALQESIHFRLAPFLWIKNLAAPDMLVYWGQNIPWISRLEDMGGFLYLGPYFNLLPVFAVALMIIQQKFLMPPATDEAQEMQQKMMKYMSIFFGILFYKVAAGLCIYFIVSSLWGIGERQLLPKAKLATAPAAPAGGPAGSSARASAVRPRPRPSKSGHTNGTFQRVQEMWTELLKQAKKK
jgi:YidC/Oxa1 family membrane protein insertase